MRGLVVRNRNRPTALSLGCRNGRALGNFTPCDWIRPKSRGIAETVGCDPRSISFSCREPTQEFELARASRAIRSRLKLRNAGSAHGLDRPKLAVGNDQCGRIGTQPTL